MARETVEQTRRQAEAACRTIADLAVLNATRAELRADLERWIEAVW